MTATPSNVVDLSKFASNNELNKWICGVLGYPDEARRTFDHQELVQLLGREVIKQRILIGIVSTALLQVGNGLLDLEGQSTQDFALELAAVIENFELPEPTQGN